MTAATRGTLDREVRFGPHQYTFHVRPAGSWELLAGQAAGLHADNFGLVYDGGLPAHLVKTVAECLAATPAPIAHFFEVPASERAKTPATGHEAEQAMLAAGFTRRSVVVALGGGLAGNVAGYAAHHIFRGVRLVHIPTTLLAMLDSTLSLKQGLNWVRDSVIMGKNVLGAFHAPTWVWCDLGFLDTLPPGQITAALGELCKNVLAIAPQQYRWTLARLRPAGDYEPAQIAEFIDFCVTAKQSIMRHDPEEHGQGLRNEYGHTAGHALEAVTGGQIPHGDAVARGVLVAAQVARNAGYMDAAAVEAHWRLLAANGLHRPVIPPSVPTGAIIRAIRADNKRGYHDDRPGCAPMVLLDTLGQPHLATYSAPDGSEAVSLLTQVPLAHVATAIDQLRDGSS